MLKQQSVMHLFFTLAFVVVANCAILPKSWTSMDIVEIQNFKNGFFETDIKVKRPNSTTVVIYGPVKFTDSVNGVDMEIQFYYSSLDKDQYVLLPYKIERKPMCFYIEGVLRKNLYPDLEKVSDLPKAVEGQPLCPLYEQKTYTLEGYYVIPEDVIPRFFKTGMYKVEFKVFKANDPEVQQTLIGIMKLY